MKLRNITIALTIAMLLMFVQYTNASSYIHRPVNNNTIISDDSLRILQIQKRLLEIKSMNFSALSPKERKDMKKELKQMQKETKTNAGGIYLSVGAIIIILLVLILITK